MRHPFQVFFPACLSLVTISAFAHPVKAASLPSSASPEAVKAFIASHKAELAKSPALRSQLDGLCRQRDCDASELFWYTDLEQAKAAAKASGKPILSLRLLGRLDEDLSCANSRFFRVAVYPNAAVNQVLRDRYILHWQSVRPVPKVTVDFGDGRKMERTITGNSIHYVLNADGQVLEALPGLYGAGAFLKHLQRSETLAKTYQKQPANQRSSFLQQYHRDRLMQLQQQWATDLRALGMKPPALRSLAVSNPPNAVEAGRLAMTKAIAESPLVMSIVDIANQNRRALTDITDQAQWTKLAARYGEDAKLDGKSRQLVQRKKATQTARELDQVVQSFEGAIALDSIRNEYLLHSQLHSWLSQDATPLNTLNARVYHELFLTPDSDPWLGLMAPDAFSAIEQDGILK